MSSQSIIVESEYGPIEGIRKESVLGMDYISFQGIPYMKPPVDNLRFAVCLKFNQFETFFCNRIKYIE